MVRASQASVDDNFYSDFTSRSGAALEAEDRLILGSGLLRKEKGGILRLNDERYYQSILWRAMISRWSAAVEYHSRHDLVLFDTDDPGRMFAVFELKLWRTSRGEAELPSFTKDIEKLRGTECPRSAFVIFSSNKRGEMLTHINWLEAEWIKRKDFAEMPRHYRYRFDTISPSGDEPAEFWVGVWPIKGMQKGSAEPAG